MAGDTSNLTDPYIQLLSLTFEEDAHADFVTVRMNGTDTSATQAPLLSTAPYWGIDDDVFGYGSAGGVNMGPRGEREDGDEDVDKDRTAMRTGMGTGTGNHFLLYLYPLPAPLSHKYIKLLM